MSPEGLTTGLQNYPRPTCLLRTGRHPGPRGQGHQPASHSTRLTLRGPSPCSIPMMCATCVFIGGFAIQIHGVEGFAPTADADITPATDDANLDRLAAALGELEARLSYRGEAGRCGRADRHLFKDKISVTFLTKHGPMDVVLLPDGTAGYDDLAEHEVSRQFGDRQVTVATVEDIVRSKRAAGRPRDQNAMRPLIEWLRRQRRDPAARQRHPAPGWWAPPSRPTAAGPSRRAHQPRDRLRPGRSHLPEAMDHDPGIGPRRLRSTLRCGAWEGGRGGEERTCAHRRAGNAQDPVDAGRLHPGRPAPYPWVATLVPGGGRTVSVARTARWSLKKHRWRVARRRCRCPVDHHRGQGRAAGQAASPPGGGRGPGGDARGGPHLARLPGEDLAWIEAAVLELGGGTDV